jgi:hypothetical protein
VETSLVKKVFIAPIEIRKGMIFSVGVSKTTLESSEVFPTRYWPNSIKKLAHGSLNEP